MPSAKPNKPINAKRIAALLAGFDIGNANETEALSKACALRRIAAEHNMRVVDLLELPEVKQAIDDQLQPVRQEAPALQDAMQEVANLRLELTERTRDVRHMAELLTQAQRGCTGFAPARRSGVGTPQHSFGRSHGSSRSSQRCWRCG